MSGIGPSPDKMLLGRLFSYSDTHRYRIGTHYLQLSINQPQVPVYSYNKDGAMRYRRNGDQPICAPNSFGSPHADPNLQAPSWFVDGKVVRSAYPLHSEDDDFGQPHTRWKKVLSETDKQHMVTNLFARLDVGAWPDIIDRVLEYWGKVHPEISAALPRASVCQRRQHPIQAVDDLSGFKEGKKHAKGYQKSLDAASLGNQTNPLAACIGRAVG